MKLNFKFKIFWWWHSRIALLQVLRLLTFDFWLGLGLWQFELVQWAKELIQLIGLQLLNLSKSESTESDTVCKFGTQSLFWMSILFQLFLSLLLRPKENQNKFYFSCGKVLLLDQILRQNIILCWDDCLKLPRIFSIISKNSWQLWQSE